MRVDGRMDKTGEVPRRGVGWCILIGVACLLVAAEIPWSSAARAQAPGGLPDGTGKAEVRGTCVKCHGSATFTAKHLVRADWTRVIEQMQGLGADVADADADVIADYLSAHFGVPMNVNKAGAQELADMFGMTAKEADAIVKYRDAHGNFSSVAEMLKIPDVDGKKIEMQSANIRFEDVPPPTASPATAPVSH
jgi:competence ComEA-like helix-hairpin-helix protein